MLVNEAYRISVDNLKKSGCQSPDFDAMCLLENAFGFTRTKILQIWLDKIPDDIFQKYIDDTNAVLDSYQYTTGSDVTYTLDETSKTAIASAKDGDTLTITYDIESNGTARYRNGIKLAGKQLYINCHDETSQGAWNDKNNYHLNGKFVKGNSQYNSVAIKYVLTLSDEGKATSVSAQMTDGYGKTITGKNDIKGTSKN